jgi:beta-glucosidase
LRELYLPPFEAAVKAAHVGTVMCAYNEVNGSFSCANRYLLTDVLGGWGFRGFTLSDYGAAHSTIDSLRNGLDFEPWPPGAAYSPANVETALASGQVTIAEINAHVERYLRTLFAFGLFDRPPYNNTPRAINASKDGGTAERIEESAITLLVNRGGVLPLKSGRLRSLAIIGAAANQFITGGGSSNVTPLSYTTAQAAIVKRAGRRLRVRIYDGSDPALAAKVARASDAAVVIAPNYQTEGVDRRCLTLECPPAFGDQDALIGRVAQANHRTIVVLETGGPVLTPWRHRIAGLLEAWYPGEEGGTAIAHVLFGDVDPGGRLPVTFPASETKTPTAGDPWSYPGVGNRTLYKERVLVGYRWYDAHRIQPAFPFGFGLSYTSFAYGALSVRAMSDRRRPVQVTLTVANDGDRAGIEVPQLYVAIPRPGQQIIQPPRQLRGFERVSLRAGARAEVTFTLTARDLAWWIRASNTGGSPAAATGCWSGAPRRTYNGPPRSPSGTPAVKVPSRA